MESKTHITDEEERFISNQLVIQMSQAEAGLIDETRDDINTRALGLLGFKINCQ